MYTRRCRLTLVHSFCYSRIYISYLRRSAEHCTFTRRRRSLSHRRSTLGILLFADGIFRQRCSRHGTDGRFQARLVHQIADSSLHIVDPTAHFVDPPQNGLAHLIEVLGLISEHERKRKEECGEALKAIFGGANCKQVTIKACSPYPPISSA